MVLFSASSQLNSSGNLGKCMYKKDNIFLKLNILIFIVMAYTLGHRLSVGAKNSQFSCVQISSIVVMM